MIFVTVLQLSGTWLYTCSVTVLIVEELMQFYNFSGDVAVCEDHAGTKEL